MGTNGIISLTHDNQVVVKIICGCNGYNVMAVAGAIIEHWDTNIYPGTPHLLHDLWTFAHCHGFGCQQCLYVMDADGIVGDDLEDQILDYYRATFDQATFNPRLPGGGGAMVVVREVPSWTI